MVRFVFVLTISFFSLSAHAETLPLTRAEIESLGDSVGSIGISKGDRLCTAFLVHPQILAGISHCKYLSKFVYFEAGSKRESYRIRRIFGLNYDGVALYHIEKPVLDRPLLKFSALKLGARFPIVAMGYPADWPKENSSIYEELPGRDFKASWSDGTSIVEAGFDDSCNNMTIKAIKLVHENGNFSKAPASLNLADKPYTSGSGMSGGPVIDSDGGVIGIHACAGGVFYSSQDALETLAAMREFLKKGGNLERVVTLPGEGRRRPAMRLALVDGLSMDYAPDLLTGEILDFILNNAAFTE